MEPPPYAKFKNMPHHSKDDDDYSDKISVPPWMMKKISAIGPHSERSKLVMKYTKKRGSIIKERQMALKLQDDILKGAIKKIKTDEMELSGARISILWSITKTERNHLGAFLRSLYRDGAWNIYVRFSLENVGICEAQKMHKTEKGKIQTTFREAVRALNEEFGILLDAMQDSHEKIVMVESVES